MLGSYAAHDDRAMTDQVKEGFDLDPRRLQVTAWRLDAPGFATCVVRNRGRNPKCTSFSFRKEVIQPQVLLRLPCYDFTPIMNYTLDGCPLAVGSPASSATHFRDVTGGVYKARERIHRGILIRDY